MKWLFSPYSLVNILDLDVALGAAGMAMLITSIFQVDVPLSYYYLLFSIVWTIYLLDHLYDSKKPEAVSERRKFFKKHYRLFWWVLFLNLLLTIVVFIYNFNIVVLLYATPAIGITSVYLLANWLFQENHQKFYLKEILISIGYAFGIMVIPLSFKRGIDLQVILLTSMIVLMALWNVLLIARFERDIDKKEGQTSMNQWVSISNIKWINYFLYTAFLFSGIMYSAYFVPGWRETIIYVLVVLYMFVPFIFPGFFRKTERYHSYVDMIFLLSFVGLLF